MDGETSSFLGIRSRRLWAGQHGACVGLRVYGGRCLRGWRAAGRTISGSYAPPPTIRPCYPFTRHLSVTHAPLLPYRSLALSLSLSLSLRPPRILFPAVCPFRLSLHILALPSPELCRIISHSPPPHCPLSAYPPRPNSCGPDIVFGAPTPPLLSWTQQFDFLDPNNFTPRLPPLICPT